MGKLIPWSFEKIRSGEQIQVPAFTNVAAAVAAGVTAAKFPRRVIYLSAASVPECIATAVSLLAASPSLAHASTKVAPFNFVADVVAATDSE